MSGFLFLARRAPLASLALVTWALGTAEVRAAPAAWQTRTYEGVVSVQSIVQTSDHHLWFAGTDGVLRFDGVAWKPVLSLPSGPARRLLVGPGGVWVATGGGFLEPYKDPKTLLRVGFRTEQGELYLVRENTSLRVDLSAVPSSWVWALAERPGTREVWAGTEDGVVQIPVSAAGQPQKPRQVVPGSSLPSPLVTSLLFEDAKSVWIGTSSGLVLATVDAGGSPHIETVLRSGVLHLTQTSTRHLFASTFDGIFEVVGNKAIKVESVGDTPSPFVTSAEKEVLAVHNGVPVALAPAKAQPFGAVQVADPLTILRDHEGSYWFGRRSGPVTHVFLPPVRNLGPPEGLLGEGAFSIHRAHDQSLWITTTKGIVHITDEASVAFRYGTDLPVWSARSIAEGADHAVYFAAENALLRYAHGAFAALTKSDGLTGDQLRSLHIDSANTLWIGWEHGGLSAFPGANIAASTRRDFAGSTQVCDGPQIFAGEAPKGTLWWSAGARGLTRVGTDHGQIQARCLQADLGLNHNEVTAVATSPQGHIWAATLGRASMARWKNNRFYPLPTACGVAAGGFFSLTTTNDRVWATSNRGVFKAAWAELEECMDSGRKNVSWLRVDEQSGMRSPICIAAFPPTAALDKAGDLWLSTTAGVSIINANRAQAPPQAVLEEFSVDGRPLPSPSQAHVKPRPQSLQWSWTAPNFLLPQAVRFRYQLQGLDRTWIDAGQERSTRYGTLPPGDYVFRVQAYLAGGAPQPAGFAQSQIHVQASLTQSWWFRIAGVLLLLGAALLWHRMRIRRLAAQHRVVHEERSRLAREIHDGLGQAFLGVRFHLDGLDHLLSKRGRDEREVELLNESRHILTHAEAQLRETIWDLRATTLERPNLKAVLEAQCARLATNLGRRVHFHWEGPMVPASGLREHELPRVIEEAVTNAIRHADAPEVDVHAERNEEELRLTIRNAAASTKPKVNPRTGFGIIGMQERAVRMGGTLTAQPLANGAFEVSLSIPAGRLHDHT